MKTTVSIEKFKGSDIFSVWELDDNGDKKKFPLVSFGKKKGEAVLTHLEELKQFCNGETITTEEIPF